MERITIREPYREKKSPEHYKMEIWFSDPQNRGQVINRIFDNIGLRGKWVEILYEPNKKMIDYYGNTRGFADCVVSVDLEDQDGRKREYALLFEHKPTIPDDVNQQIQFYEGFLIKKTDRRILCVLLTLDANTIHDTNLRTNKIQILRIDMESKDNSIMTEQELSHICVKGYRLMVETIKTISDQYIALGFDRPSIEDEELKYAQWLYQEYGKVREGYQACDSCACVLPDDDEHFTYINTPDTLGHNIMPYCNECWDPYTAIGGWPEE